MPFVTELVVQELTDRDLWQLRENLVYEGNTDQFTVPAGTLTDFASVPKPFQWLVPRHGRYNKAAVLHDHLSRQADKGEISSCDADGVFRRTMRELGVPTIRRWLMWGAVRWGARLHGSPFPETLLVLAMTILAIPFVLPGTAVVVISHFAYQILEKFVYGIRRAASLLRIGERPKEPGPEFKMFWSS